MDYPDATALYRNPQNPRPFPLAPHSHEPEAKLSKQPLAIRRRSSFKISPPVLEGLLRCSDILLLCAALPMACILNAFIATADVPTRNEDILIAVIATGATALCLHWGRSYALTALRSAAAQAQAVGVSLAASLIVILLILLVLQPDQTAERKWALQWLLSATSLLGLCRLALARMIHRWERAGCFTRSIAIIGDSNIGLSVIARAAMAESDDRIVGLYHDRPSSAADATSPPIGAPFVGGINDLIARCRQERIDCMLITVPISERQRIADITRHLSVTVSDVYVAIDIAGLNPASISHSTPQIRPIANELAVLVKQRPLKDWKALQKRVFDVVVASLLLFFLAPFMGLIALLIKLDSPGPVMFLQPRFGFNNNLFNVYKFRSMRHEMADILADQQTKKDDERITSIGKWLRKLSMDELPQLYNVLLGDMSLVGPRPHAPNTKAGGMRFTEIMAEEYAQRHRVLPGITGWAQVNGWRGETQTVDQLKNRIFYDLHYIENWSLLFDIKILLLTLRRGIAGRQAY